jgi:dipeptidyl aminopeptidase/acylaminoacyl peptidase
MKKLIMLGASVLLALSAEADMDRVFDVDTYLAMKRISQITVSADGAFLAYTVSHNDLEEDTSRSAVWMQPTAGGEPVRMTAADSAAWSPKWSPDDRYLAVLSNRNDGATQVWLLDRRGGDAPPLPDFTHGVRSSDGAPDGPKRLRIEKDPWPAAPGE